MNDTREELPNAHQIFQVLTFLHQLPVDSTSPVEDVHRLRDALERSLIANNFQQPFDWGSLQGEAERLVDDAELLKRCDLQTCVKLLTLHLRKDRFCGGHLASMIECGHIARILKRLWELVETGAPLQPHIQERFNELCRLVERTMPERMDLPGSSLYSPPWTLTRGDVLLLGTNPGGGGMRTPAAMTLRENLEFRGRNRDRHSFFDSLAGRQNVISKRLSLLMESVGCDIRGICAINLMFSPSAEATTSGYPEEAILCWPVIEWLIGQVRPKLIIAFGNSGPSPFQFIRKHVLSDPPAVGKIAYGHGAATIKSFHSELAGVSTTVIGIPHPSRFDPVDKPGLIKLIRRTLGDYD